MKKIIFVLLAFLAIFTYIRANDNVEAKGNQEGIRASVEITR